MTMISLVKVVKRYDRVEVVDLDVPLEIRPGERVDVVGPSGAGKTTLARLVAGLETPDDGEIYFDGRLMNAVPPGERKVGLMLRDDALWPHLTVAENVAYPLKVRGVARRERRARVAEALNAARIETAADRYPEALTPLQRRRVALARLAVSEPDVLVLDEPLGRLEGPARDEFRDAIRRLPAELGATTLVLTSDPREALAAADRLAVMDLGRLIQVGPPADVYNLPADAMVARLLGPVNLIQGQVDGPGGRGEVVVRTPIGRLVGRAVGGDLGEGAPVTVAIRPESLALGPGHSLDSNRFPATVERQVFLGELREFHLRGPGDWPVVARALQGSSANYREGQSLTVSVPPAAVVVLRGRDAGVEEPG